MKKKTRKALYVTDKKFAKKSIEVCDRLGGIKYLTIGRQTMIKGRELSEEKIKLLENYPVFGEKMTKTFKQDLREAFDLSGTEANLIMNYQNTNFDLRKAAELTEINATTAQQYLSTIRRAKHLNIPTEKQVRQFLRKRHFREIGPEIDEQIKKAHIGPKTRETIVDRRKASILNRTKYSPEFSRRMDKAVDLMNSKDLSINRRALEAGRLLLRLADESEMLNLTKTGKKNLLTISESPSTAGDLRSLEGDMAEKAELRLKMLKE